MPDDTPVTARHQVLLVEANPDGEHLMRESFADLSLHADLHCVSDVRHCLAFLDRRGRYAGAPRPSLILLDLDLPDTGSTVLRHLAHDRRLRDIPVIVFSAVLTASEVKKLYGWRCSSVVRKPADYVEFLHFVQLLRDYWLTLVMLPVSSETKSVPGEVRPVAQTAGV